MENSLPCSTLVVTPPKPHIVLFPFMSKGHTVPLIHLGRLLLRRGATVTIFSTAGNAPFITESLPCNKHPHLSVLTLPFPHHHPPLPPGVESTDKLPSISLFLPFVSATKLLKPHFDLALRSLPTAPSAIISDGFLPWTLASAAALSIPRFVFYGMSNYALAVSHAVGLHRLVATVDSPDVPFSIPTFPWIRLTVNDLDPPFNDPNPSGPMFEHVMEVVTATMNSHGMVVNSFYELEPVFADSVIRDQKLKTWNVGPLSLAAAENEQQHGNIKKKKPHYMQWLDEMEKEEKPVLYVAFGSQADISEAQIMEIGDGLEKSGVNFMWVVRPSSSCASAALHEGRTYKNEEESTLWLGEFERRVRGRGVVVREWVGQVEVLRHGAVRGFMSHCGWNSVVESVSAGVAMVAWPMMADQHLNARMVVEELGVGVRVMAEGGSVRGFVKAETVEAAVRELMEGGERGKEARRRVEELREGANKAVREGGSSWKALDDLLQHISP